MPRTQPLPPCPPPQVGADSQLEAFREALAPQRGEGGTLAGVTDATM